ncbi:hypothetical protein [Virgibacillus salexigens]|uniref:Uncharacterized protein n=2 Tax=Virgibacillus TaxID=84406 RepID=A0A024QBI1_9BACI|nr:MULTISPECIES: hypothetical protein [Virgibacillus]GGJ48561.1 hypothetical protein GCM10007111_08350 [Virgibacillus kapii]CDQ39540.1 hypothetical protein BN990_01845 [Virgibacillus massiliensis]
MGDKNNLEKAGEAISEAGNTMMGCGCLLTIFITIPIILLFLFL